MQEVVHKEEQQKRESKKQELLQEYKAVTIAAIRKNWEHTHYLMYAPSRLSIVCALICDGHMITCWNATSHTPHMHTHAYTTHLMSVIGYNTHTCTHMHTPHT